MRKLALLLMTAIIANVAVAQEKICTNEAVSQTRTKIREHYANQGLVGSLEWISTVDLSGVVSNGVAHKGPEFESVYYTTYIIVGTLVLKGGGRFHDYAFYVRLNDQTCEVLKVALLRAGKSPFLVMTQSRPDVNMGGGLVKQTGALSEIETPKDGSPRVGFTYAGKDETSVPALPEHSLRYFQERAEQLVKYQIVR